VDTALRVADAEGLEAVTIRRLAQDLGVTPMALYWHFKDKEALLAALADRTWAECSAELDLALAARSGSSGGDWDQLLLTVELLVTVMRRHPAVAGLVPMRVTASEAGLRITEQTLGFLNERGFDPQRSAEIARYVLCSAVMLVESEPGAEVARLHDRDEVMRQKHLALAALPPERYPHVVASAPYLTDCGNSDEYFSRAVSLVVDGIRAQVPVAGRRRRP
jgi:TetR/AcrR family tetracycline transcriptional repressor